MDLKANHSLPLLASDLSPNRSAAMAFKVHSNDKQFPATRAALNMISNCIVY